MTTLHQSSTMCITIELQCFNFESKQKIYSDVREPDKRSAFYQIVHVLNNNKIYVY